MILYCAADPNYFENYFDLWARQCNKHYSNFRKLVALYKPTEEAIRKCNHYKIEYRDITDKFVTNPTRNHFYLLRWLFLPYDLELPILETQINCLPIQYQKFDKINVEHLRISRMKRGKLGGVSAAIFTSKGAEKVVKQARGMMSDPPDSDHSMNVWQEQNLTHRHIKGEQQFKILNRVIEEDTCWITAGTSQHWSVKQKLEILRHYIR